MHVTIQNYIGYPTWLGRGLFWRSPFCLHTPGTLGSESHTAAAAVTGSTRREWLWLHWNSLEPGQWNHRTTWGPSPEPTSRFTEVQCGVQQAGPQWRGKPRLLVEAEKYQDWRLKYFHLKKAENLGIPVVQWLRTPTTIGSTGLIPVPKIPQAWSLSQSKSQNLKAKIAAKHHFYDQPLKLLNFLPA